MTKQEEDWKEMLPKDKLMLTWLTGNYYVYAWLNHWEGEFVKQLIHQGGQISIKQLEKLNEIYKKNRTTDKMVRYLQ